MQNLDYEAPPLGRELQPGIARAVTIWIAHTVERTSNDLMRAIRSQPHLDIRLLGGVEASNPGPQDLLIVDPAYLRSVVGLGETTSSAALAPCRGGLAPYTLRRVKAAIEERISEGISLAELAALAGLSECHFARAFKQSIGVPPHRYLLQRRLSIAAALIRDTDQHLVDIALAAGFSDQSHFTRCFVRHRRETPSAFRRRHR